MLMSACYFKLYLPETIIATHERTALAQLLKEHGIKQFRLLLALDDTCIGLSRRGWREQRPGLCLRERAPA